MPNLKIYVEQSTYLAKRDALSQFLVAVQDLICAEVQVPASACQFAVLPVLAMPEHAPINLEIQILPHPTRTRDHLTAVFTRLRTQAEAALAVKVAIRATTLDPEKYIAIK